MRRTRNRIAAAGLLCAGLAAGACTPRVVVEAPREPIVINLNVKIEHEIRVKVEKDLEQEFEKNDGIF